MWEVGVLVSQTFFHHYNIPTADALPIITNPLVTDHASNRCMRCLLCCAARSTVQSGIVQGQLGQQHTSHIAVSVIGENWRL